MNPITMHLIALSVLIFTSVASLAADERLLGVLDETADIGQVVEAREFPNSLLTVGGVNVFHSELSSLRSKYGLAPVARLSSREGAPFALCYVADGQGVIFRAGAMGGWKRVTGFTVLHEATLRSLSLNCARSEVIAAWMHQAGKTLFNGQQLSNKFGMKNLPLNGVIVTKKMRMGGKQYLRTSIVAYSEGFPLTWVDISQFDER